jgi:hypothetical protein
MTQVNPTPFVAFALIAMIICGLLGIMVGLDPFGPGQDVRAEQVRTQLAVEIRATENALSASETLQAFSAQQTAVVAQLTAMPAQQTATQVAGAGALQNAQISATQTAIAEEALMQHLRDQATQTSMAQNLYLNNLERDATATAVVQKQVRELATITGGLILSIVATVIVSALLVARTFIQTLAARAQEKTAQAQYLAEQRRLESLRASLNTQKKVGTQQYSVPTSLMEKPGDGKELPRAE